MTRTNSLLRPIDGAWLAALRMMLGLTLAASMWRFLANGWVELFFDKPRFFFKYWGFEWVHPLPGAGMRWLVWALVALAVCVAAGALFRLTAPLFVLGLAYVQLIDVSTYLNHYYLAVLLAALLAASPAHRTWSVDAWRARRRGCEAGASVSAVWLYLFRLQVGVVYFFAGMAKLQSDWLIHAQPLRIWLGESTDLPLVGPLLALPGTPLLLSWAGFLFDTTIVAFLLHRRSRPYAYAVVVLFHAATRALLPIGMFPIIMTTAALVFFEPSWPRSLLRRWVEPSPPLAAPALSAWARRFGLVVAACYCLLQLALPLRFLVYRGNVLWHEQGMRFSWRVMVRAKGGGTTFLVHSLRTGHTWHVSPRDYLTSMQESEMSSQPDLIVQLAKHIQRDFSRRGVGPVEVRAEARAALNGRRSAPLIDPSVDLTRVEDGLARVTFVPPAPSQAPTHTRPVL